MIVLPPLLPTNFAQELRGKLCPNFAQGIIVPKLLEVDFRYSEGFDWTRI
jgi:hypothetical protein